MIKDFWEEKHSENNLSSLSGHPGQTVLNGLYLYKLPKDNCRVLEIGVGLGHCTKDLTTMGAVVDVLDISETALARVRGITKKQFLATAVDTLPENTYDLAISYCVTQHINNESLRKQLVNVIRSLKSDGIFAMQYAVPYHASGLVETEVSLQAGSVCREITDMHDMIIAAGGKIVYHRIWGFFSQYHSGWAIVHIMRDSVVAQ